MVNYVFDVLNYVPTNHRSLQLWPPQVHDSQAERNEPMSYVDAAALVTGCEYQSRLYPLPQVGRGHVGHFHFEHPAVRL